MGYGSKELDTTANMGQWCCVQRETATVECASEIEKKPYNRLRGVRSMTIIKDHQIYGVK